MSKGHRDIPKRSDPGCGRVFSSESGFTHKTSDIEGTGEDIAEVLGLGAFGLAEPRRTFQVSPSLVGVAAFGIAETTDA